MSIDQIEIVYVSLRAFLRDIIGGCMTLLRLVKRAWNVVKKGTLC